MNKNLEHYCYTILLGYWNVQRLVLLPGNEAHNTVIKQAA
jgi:hypothetical protein